MRALRLFSAAVVSATLVTAISACDGGTGAAGAAGGADEATARSALAASAEVMRAAGTGSVEMTSPEGSPSRTVIARTVKGVADWKDGSAVEFDGVGGDTERRTRVVGGATYQGLPASMVRITGGKHWVASRAAAATAQDAALPDNLSAMAQLLNPLVHLDAAARNGTLSTAGSEVVDGVPTRRYRSVESARSLTALLAPAGAAGPAQSFRDALRGDWKGDDETFVAEFAVNDRHELVRIRLYLRDAAEDSLGAAAAPTVLRYSALGSASRVEAPAASDLMQDPRAARPAAAADRPMTVAAVTVRAAAANAAQQTSYRTVRTGPEGSGERAVMAFRRAAQSEIESWGNAPQTSRDDGHQHVVVTGGQMYFRVVSLPGKSWFSMDLPTGDPQAKGLLPTFLGVLGTAPDLVRVAAEDVGGRPTVHYRGSVTVSVLATYEGTAIDGFQRDAFVKDARARGLERASIDVWLGEGALPVRARESGVGSKGPLSVTEDYSDYGVDPRITAPPAADVISVDDFLAGNKAKLDSLKITYGG